MWFQTVHYLIYDLLRFPADDILVHVLEFLVYDFFKIFFLVFLIILVISFLRTYISDDKLERFMRRKMFGFNYLVAALLGAITPFCSCSGIPIFIGFLRAGVPLGVSITFLTASPLVNEVAVIILANYFGWKIAGAYALSGIVLGVVAGLVMKLLKLDNDLILVAKAVECDCSEHTVSDDKYGEHCSSACCNEKPHFHNALERIRTAWMETKSSLKEIYAYLFFGVFLGAVIHGYIPRELILSYVGGKEWWAVPLAVLIGVPIYAGCSTVAPLIVSITAQGVPLGTSLALMMAIAGLSLPEALILKSIMKMRLLAVYFFIVTVGIILTGYLFNLLF